MSKKVEKLRVIKLNFSSVPVPVFKEVRGKDYVPFGSMRGYVNNYPQYLEDLYDKSAKHRALVDGKCEFLAGRGFGIDPLANITNEARAQINLFIGHANSDESLKEVNKKFIWDQVVHGGFYMEIIWNNDNGIAAINHMPFKDIRRSADGETFYFTSDWSKTNPSKNEDWDVIEAFDINNKSGKGILFVGDSRNIYPLPSYLAAINHIEADIELSIFDLSNIQNQFQPSAMIEFFNGEPSQEEADEIERQFRQKFQGSENAGEILLNFSDDPDRAAKITTLTPSNLDKQYQVLEQRIDSSLLVAHRVINPILFGWNNTGGGLSNNADELRTATEAYQNRFVTPVQNDFEDLYNNILSVNGLPKVLEIKPLESISPQLSTATMEANLTQDEIRARMGLEPIEGVNLNVTAEALGSLSPLVATKVLDNMTTTEIRDIVGLPESNVVRRRETVSKQFSKEKAQELILEHFEGCGVDADKYTVINSKELYVEDLEEFEMSDIEFRQEFKVLSGLNSNDLQILSALNENPLATIPELEEATGIPKPEVEISIDKLQESGALRVGEEIDGQVDREVTEDGKETLEDSGEPELQVMYRYALRSDAPPLKTKSRDFCKRLMATNKLFTKDEIFRLNNSMGLDVFRFRGGYYNNPSIGRTTPWCRHIWSQQLVKTK